MEKCLIVINFNAGSSKKISFEKVEKCLGNRYEYTHLSLPQDKFSSSKGFDAVAVCGGDGTLASIIQDAYDKPIKVFYFPVGTLNDKAKAVRYANARAKCPSCDETPRTKPIVVGKLNALIKDGDYLTTDCGEDIFTYVLASGSFTPIGYTSTPEEKKRFGTLAYIAKIIKEYRPYRMKTSIICDKKKYDGEFTLVMFVKSPRCFGFKFNKAFNQESTSGHLLAIRSPKHDGFLGCAEMFFPFFKAFFIGLKKERDKGKIIFKQVYSATLENEDEMVFCKDGEMLKKDKGIYKISFKRTLCDFCVIEKF